MHLMSRSLLFANSFRRLAAGAAVALLCASAPALAQNDGAAGGQGTGQTGQAGNTPPSSDIPEDAFASALAGNEGLRALGNYLGTGSEPPEVVARRAADLIRALGQRRGTLSSDRLIGAVDRIARIAASSFGTARVIRMGFSDGFRPGPQAMALDFGSRDGAVMPGFQRVVAGDSRISGDGVSALRRPENNALLSDGLVGVRKIELPVPNGRYRIILMTQNLNDQQLGGQPFGQVILINGVPIQIASGSPDSWSGEALFANPDILPASAGGAQGGFLSGNIGAQTSQLFVRQQGGALILEGVATEGKLTIEMRGPATARSYITGLIVEPADSVSSVMLSEETRRQIVPITTRVALETEILAAAAEAVQGIEPVAGNPLESPDSLTTNTAL